MTDSVSAVTHRDVRRVFLRPLLSTVEGPDIRGCARIRRGGSSEAASEAGHHSPDLRF